MAEIVSTPQKLDDLNGHFACVSWYMETHSFLVLRIGREHSPQVERYLLCYYCRALPERLSWTIEELRISKVAERQWIVCDHRAGIAIPCGAVSMREEFDMRKYLAIDEVPPLDC